MGKLFDLNGENDVIGYSPDGLGFYSDNNKISDNNSSRVIDIKILSNDVTLNILFGKNDRESTYELYKDFVQFLSFGDLTLIYEDFEGKVYERKCVLKELTKNDRNFYLRLNEKITLTFTSNWYLIEEYKDYPDQNQIKASGFLLPETFPFTFGTLSSERQTVFKIKNDSVYLLNNDRRMSPVKIRITATTQSVKNPSWKVIQDSKIVASDGFDITISEGWTLEVSSLFQERTCLLIDPYGNKSSVYQQQDITKTGFVHVPAGESDIVFDVRGANVECTVFEEADLF